MGNFVYTFLYLKGIASPGPVMINAKEKKLPPGLEASGCQFVSSALNLLISCSIFIFNMLVQLNLLNMFHWKADIVCVLGDKLRKTKGTSKYVKLKTAF